MDIQEAGTTSEEERLFGSLPAYVYADCCEERHYLFFNKAIDGTWAFGYMDMATGNGVSSLCFNDAATLKEATTRLRYALERFRRAKAA